MSCYALDFKDRDGRRITTLENWKNSDYLDLSYNMKSQAITMNTANVTVEWMIKIASKGGGQPEESKTVLNVELKKEEGSWKIKEIKPVS